MNVHILGSEEPVKEELPDSRLRDCERTTICGPCGIMSRVYCVNCGADGGLVTEEWVEHVFYLCDKCAETVGRLPDVVQVPDAVVQGKEKF